MIVRGFGVFEDRLEQEIAAMLPEPLPGLTSTPFRHKLNLAGGLGLVEKDARSALKRLAQLRHDLAHADREPEDVSVAELEEIRAVLDPAGGMRAEVGALFGEDAAGLAAVTILAAYVRLQLSGSAVHHVRELQHEALMQQVGTRLGLPAAVRATLKDVETGAQTGAQEQDSA